MKKIFAPLILAAIAAITFASAQPGPGPQPNPWVKSGDSISYSLGGILAPSSVTGGSKGVGTVNASNLYINGNAVPQSVFGRTGAVTAQSGDYSFSLISGTAAATQGGTGLTTGSSGGVLYFDSTSTIASSAMLAGNQLVLGGGSGTAPVTLGSLGTSSTVLHGNASGAPTFGAVVLTSDVSGTLPVANGGTGAVTVTGLVLGNGASAMTAYAGTSCTNQFPRSLNASGSAACAAVDLTTDVTGTLPAANGGTGLTAFTRSGNTTEFASVAAGVKTSGNVATWDASGNIQDGGVVPAQTSGTWTPTYIATGGGAAGAYLYQGGTYLKTGKQVHIEFGIRGNPGTLAGLVRIGGLPFTSSNVANATGTCAVGVFQGWTFGGVLQVMGGTVYQNSTEIVLSASGTTAGYADITPAMFGGNALLSMTCDYTVP